MHYSINSAAGKALGRALSRYYNSDAIVLAISRGAVDLGTEIAQSLHVPLRLLLVGKIKDPDHMDRVIGAVVNGRSPVYFYSQIDDSRRLRQEVNYARYHLHIDHSLYDPFYGQSLQLSGKTVIIVDTCINTGLAMEAVVQAVRQMNPERVVVAAVGLHRAGRQRLSGLTDEVVSLERYYFTHKYSRYYLDYWPKDIATVRFRLRKAGGQVGSLLPQRPLKLSGRAT